MKLSGTDFKTKLGWFQNEEETDLVDIDGIVKGDRIRQLDNKIFIWLHFGWTSQVKSLLY